MPPSCVAYKQLGSICLPWYVVVCIRKLLRIALARSTKIIGRAISSTRGRPGVRGQAQVISGCCSRIEQRQVTQQRRLRMASRLAHLVLLSVAMLVFFMTDIGYSAAQGLCPSNVKKMHNHGDLRFTTSSQVRQGSSTWIYEACVENLTSSELWINWYIPELASYILPHQALPWPRHRHSREPYDGAAGCLEYGPLATLTPNPVDFLAHASDKPAIESEQQNGCKGAQRNKYTASGVTPSDVKVEAAIFVASDRGNPGQTLFQVNVTAAVTIRDTMISDLAYSIKAVHKDGSLSDLRIRPIFDRIDERNVGPILDAFKVQHGRLEFRPDNSGGITLSLPVPKAPAILQDLRYGFFDRNDLFTGSISMPIWVEASQ